MNATQGVYMDPSAVSGIATRLGSLGNILINVNQAMERLMGRLKSTAFVGRVGGNAVASYLDVIQPQIKQVADKCLELEQDLQASIKAYEQGDAQGATRFH